MTENQKVLELVTYLYGYFTAPDFSRYRDGIAVNLAYIPWLEERNNWDCDCAEETHQDYRECPSFPSQIFDLVKALRDTDGLSYFDNVCNRCLWPRLDVPFKIVHADSPLCPSHEAGSQCSKTSYGVLLKALSLLYIPGVAAIIGCPVPETDTGSFNLQEVTEWLRQNWITSPTSGKGFFYNFHLVTLIRHWCRSNTPYAPSCMYINKPKTLSPVLYIIDSINGSNPKSREFMQDINKIWAEEGGLVRKGYHHRYEVVRGHNDNDASSNHENARPSSSKHTRSLRSQSPIRGAQAARLVSNRYEPPIQSELYSKSSLVEEEIIRRRYQPHDAARR